MAALRTKRLEIQLTEEEYSLLVKRKTKARLAEWVRETCLRREPSRKARSVQKVDPALLMALARIGGNLNQIARHLNTDHSMEIEKKIEHLTELASIEQSIEAIYQLFVESKKKANVH